MPLKYNVFFIILLCGLLPYAALLPDVCGEVHTATLAQSCFLKAHVVYSIVSQISVYVLSSGSC